MRESFHPVALSFGVAGVLTLARQAIELTEPAYYDPLTGLDFAAAWLTSIAGGMTAFALLLWWRRTPIRRGSWLLLIAALGFALSAVGNVLGDVFDLAVGDDLYFAGAVGFGATLLAGVLALTVRNPYRWSGLFLIGYAAGFAVPDLGGLWLGGVSFVAMGYWIMRTSSTASADLQTTHP